MPRSQTSDITIKTYVGNVWLYPVNIRQFNSKEPQNVSSATQILVEWEDASGANQTPITLSAAEVGADWTNGVVIIPIGPTNFTAAEGRYTFGLTLFINSQIRTYSVGQVFVAERPGV